MIHRLLYGKTRQQRWLRYLLLKDAYIKAQAQTRPQNALRQVFRKLGYGVPAAPIEECWSTLVSLGVSQSPQLDPETVRMLEMRIEVLNANVLPVLAWLDLYRLAIGIGLFIAAGKFRDKALERSVDLAPSEKATKADLTTAFYANLERRNYESAGALLELLPRHGCSDNQLEQASWIVDLFSGRELPQQFGFEGQASGQDLEFGRYIQGRSLALVGPVPTESENGENIDSHDIVVKFSYRGGEKGRNPLMQGQRLDISYYNNTQAEHLAGGSYSDIFEEIDWGVCINRKGRRQFPSTVANLRQIASLQWMLPDTHFNAGPNAVIDLLRFHPSGLKIFNTDLMLSAGRYAGYRPEGAKPIEYTRSFIKTHDPILQYNTMQRLWELGYVVGDERFESVMTMGLSSYLTELQGVHGAHEQALL